MPHAAAFGVNVILTALRIRPDRNPSCRRQAVSTSVSDTVFREVSSRWESGIPGGVWRGPEQPQVTGTGHGLLSGMNCKMAQDMGHVVIHGAAADGKDLRDFAVRLPVGDEIEHLAFTRSQP